MVYRKRSQYAKSYSFGTDGSAALAGSPLSSHRPTANAGRRKAARRGLILPRWVILLILLAGVLFMLSMISDESNESRAIRQEIAYQQNQLAAAQVRDQELEAQMETIDDEVRIRSVAMNRLGMEMPTQEQIYRIPVPQVVTETAQGSADAEQGTDFFSTIKSMFSMLFGK